MSKPLSGEHLCLAHQGNYSHYAEHNCTICTQAKRIAELGAQISEMTVE
ncbi:hypothetical protein UFOVP138_32 [uncultured Caudovirales phage]|uniref:Uncharacterized protein n=1 Tax=uncultured Caudovirales phage TaxID=2100421 RepID=A0A6J5LDL7_9CAUD|nr:hypothetical protein UFOVP138_32 [uncultured Caudovirales phage]